MSSSKIIGATPLANVPSHVIGDHKQTSSQEPVQQRNATDFPYNPAERNLQNISSQPTYKEAFVSGLKFAAQTVHHALPMDMGKMEELKRIKEHVEEHVRNAGLPPRMPAPKRAFFQPINIPSEGVVTFPNPEIIDSKESAELHLKRISAPAVEKSPFVHAILQPEGINVDNLCNFFSSFSEGLGKVFGEDKGIEAIQKKMCEIKSILVEAILKRYKLYDDNHRDDMNLRYLSQGQLHNLVADFCRDISKVANHEAKRKGLAPEVKHQYETLANYMTELKRTFSSHAHPHIIYESVEYKRAVESLASELERFRETPGYEEIMKKNNYIGAGVSIGVNQNANLKALLTIGKSAFEQSTTVRDYEQAVTRLKGVRLAGIAQAMLGAEHQGPVGVTKFEQSFSYNDGTTFKAENLFDRELGKEWLAALKRTHWRGFNSQGPSLRARTATITHVKNVIGSVLFGEEQKSADKGNYITTEKTELGKYNEKYAQSIVHQLDGSNDTSKFFEALAQKFHPSMGDRMDALDQLTDYKAKDINRIMPTSKFPEKISGLPRTEMGEFGKQVTGPQWQFESATVATATLQADEFDAKTTKAAPTGRDHPVATASATTSAVFRKSANDQQRHQAPTALLRIGKDLPSAIFRVLNECREIYSESNPSSQNGEHPFLTIRNHYDLKGVVPLVSDDWSPDDAEQGLYGAQENMSPQLRACIAGMRISRDDGSPLLQATTFVEKITSNFISIEKEIKDFFAISNEAFSKFNNGTSESRKESLKNFSDMNMQYFGGAYKLPKTLKSDDIKLFYGHIYNQLTMAAVENAAYASVARLEGAKQLATAPSEKKEEFRIAVNKNKELYDRINTFLSGDYLMMNIIQQREFSEVYAAGNSEKNEWRLRGSFGVDMGQLAGKYGDNIPKSSLAPQSAVCSFEYKYLNVLSNINPMRVGRQHVLTLFAAAGIPIASVAKPLMQELKAMLGKSRIEKQQEQALRELIEITKALEQSPMDMVFGRSGAGVEYTYTVPAGVENPARTLSSQREVKFQSTNLSVSFLGDVLKPVTPIGIIEMGTSTAIEAKIPVSTEFGESPADMVLSMNKMGPKIGIKATGEMHPFEQIRQNFLAPEGEVFLNSLMSSRNALIKSLELFRQAAVNDPKIPQTEFHTLLYGGGIHGENIRQNIKVAEHISPDSSKDVFNVPKLNEGIYDSLIKKAKEWPPYDAKLDELLCKMTPKEQLDFYTQDPKGQQLLTNFFSVFNTANLHLSVLKGAYSIGYTNTPNKAMIQNLPVAGQAHSINKRIMDAIKTLRPLPPAAPMSQAYQRVKTNSVLGKKIEFPTVSIQRKTQKKEVEVPAKFITPDSSAAKMKTETLSAERPQVEINSTSAMSQSGLVKNLTHTDLMYLIAEKATQLGYFNTDLGDIHVIAAANAISKRYGVNVSIINEAEELLQESPATNKDARTLTLKQTVMQDGEGHKVNHYIPKLSNGNWGQTPADGDCFYSACLQALRDVGMVDVDNQSLNVKMLRIMTANEILVNPTEYSDSITDEHSFQELFSIERNNAENKLQLYREHQSQVEGLVDSSVCFAESNGKLVINTRL